MISYSRLASYLALCATSLLVFSGCAGKTPEERLQQAIQFYQQKDTLSAEAEAKKVIEKTPLEDPAGIQARMLIAQIAGAERRFDDALAQLQPVLDKLSQKDQMGRKVLQTQLALLQEAGRFDEAVKLLDETEKKYANDESVVMNSKVGRADIQIKAGQTTAARETLVKLKDQTTSPAELELYRDLLLQSYLRDRDTTAAIGFITAELAGAKSDADRRNLHRVLAGLSAAVGNYQETRKHLEAVTALYDKALEAELNTNRKIGLTFELARIYDQLGNLSGARRTYQSIFDSNPGDPQLVQPLVVGMVEVLMRQGQHDAAITFLKEAATRYPSGPFAQQVAALEGLKAQNQLAVRAPADTSTITLRFRDDAPLVPKNLPVTTGTLASSGTSVTATATSQQPTSGTIQ